MESVSKRTMSNQNTGNTVQQMESEFTPGVEIKIIVAVIFLMAFGLVMIFSASSYTSSISSATNYDSAFYFKKQLKMIILGMVAAGVVSVIPYKAFRRFGAFDVWFIDRFDLCFKNATWYNIRRCDQMVESWNNPVTGCRCYKGMYDYLYGILCQQILERNA